MVDFDEPVADAAIFVRGYGPLAHGAARTCRADRTIG